MYNILVCDDERDITDALKIYLTTEGYKVYTAFNGQEAVDVALKEDIQLVMWIQTVRFRLMPAS